MSEVVCDHPSPRSRRALAFLSLAGLIVAPLMGYSTALLWGRAMVACEAWEGYAGLVPYAFDGAALSLLVGATFLLPLWLLAGRATPLVGLSLALALVVVVEYTALQVIVKTIREAALVEACPTGLPIWWPDWLPR